MTASGRLPNRVLAAYSLPSIAEQIMIAPMFVILPTLYAQHSGIALTTLGLAFMAARIFDAVIDPVIGFMSDQTRSPWGARKPWMILGAALSVIGVWFLFRPPEGVSVLYFLAGYGVLFLGWSLMMIPYNAWGLELTGDYKERSRLFAVRNWLGGVGGLLFMLSPILLQRLTGSTEFSFEVLGVVAWVVVFALPLSVIACVSMAPSGALVAQERSTLRGLGGSIRRNKVLWRFMLITFLGAVAIAIAGTLQFLYLTAYMRLGAHAPLILVAQAIASLSSIPLWLWVVQRFGKHKPWAFSRFGLVFLAPMLFFLPPGEESLLAIIAISCAAGVLAAVGSISPFSMLGDIVDYDTYKTGVIRAGNYFSFLTLLSMICTAIGAGLAFVLSGLVGFNPQGENSQPVIFAFLAILALLPGCLYLIEGYLILGHPLTENRQRAIRSRIERRAALARAHANAHVG